MKKVLFVAVLAMCMVGCCKKADNKQQCCEGEKTECCEKKAECCQQAAEATEAAAEEVPAEVEVVEETPAE